MTQTGADRLPERTSEAGKADACGASPEAEPNRAGTGRADGATELTSGNAAEAIERATAAVGQSEDDERT